MIKKIKVLKNIGRFYNFASTNNELDLSKNTVLYAHNGYGKSTIVDILRSLTKNLPDYILGRKTLGFSDVPKAVIKINDKDYCFNNGVWNHSTESPPKILIFDSEFIADNIFANTIDHNHKKNLHGIIIGAKGIELSKELKDLRGVKGDLTKSFQKLETELNNKFPNTTIEELVKMQANKLDSIQSKISLNDIKIKHKQQELVIDVLKKPKRLQPLSRELCTQVNSIMEKDLISLHAESSERVLNHIKHNCDNKKSAFDFLVKGLGYSGESCPFCGQDLKNAEVIITAYRHYFDKNHQDLLKSIQDMFSTFKSWNLENKITAIIANFSKEVVKIERWNDYKEPTKNFPNTEEKINALKPSVLEAKNKVEKEIEKKSTNINYSSDNSVVGDLVKLIEQVNSAIEIFNDFVDKFCQECEKLRASISETSLPDLKKEQERLKKIEEALSDESSKFVLNYGEAKANEESCILQIQKKQNELRTYSTEIFNKHERRINSLLEKLGADFRITDFKGSPDLRSPYADYDFEILGKKIAKNENPQEPNFKNTLSQGDKNTLAFAFFISYLEQEIGLKNAIVVFDDPLSSLDENRRIGTGEMLREISSKVQQLFILTHHKEFLNLLKERIDHPKFLKLKSDVTNGSELIKFDIEEFLNKEQFKLIDEIKKYIDEDSGQNPDDMRGKIRKVLENAIKYKYYPEITAKTLGAMLIELFEKQFIVQNLKDKLDQLNFYSRDEHHGEDSGGFSMSATRTEVLTQLRETLDVLKKI